MQRVYHVQRRVSITLVVSFTPKWIVCGRWRGALRRLLPSRCIPRVWHRRLPRRLLILPLIPLLHITTRRVLRRIRRLLRTTILPPIRCSGRRVVLRWGRILLLVLRWALLVLRWVLVLLLVWLGRLVERHGRHLAGRVPLPLKVGKQVIPVEW